jgi:ferritin-like metal-binding protein YciE
VSSSVGVRPDAEERETMKKEKVQQLLLEGYETEMGGVLVYETALRCVQNEDLKKEWTEYLEQTEKHVEIMRGVLEKLGIDPDMPHPARDICKHVASSLVKTMEMALKAGDPDSAQVVACECVSHAETKDHLNWELLGEVAEKLTGDEKKVIEEALEEVEEEEDEHYYHTMGWTRELWLQGLGVPAVVPPPEEEKDVHTMIGAARAKQSRRQMLKGKRQKKEKSS